MKYKLTKKQKIILIAIIILLITIIATTIIYAISNEKSKLVYAKSQEKNEVLIVGIKENEISKNTQEENNIIENNIIENNTEEANIEQKNTVQNNKNVNGKRYKLEVNCEQNVVNVYEKDENGEYTNCVKAMLCSVGPATPTSGTYNLKKYSGWEWKGLFGDVYGQYATQITGNILFHSVPYTEKYNKASLEYWEYDKLGTSASMGCVRLTVKNAKWIYDNCASGTQVKFYLDSNPGPLGKPSEAKISSEEKYRNWDPTDPNSDNPWKNRGNQNNNTPSENDDNIKNSENTNVENSNQENHNNENKNNEKNNNQTNNNELGENNNTVENNEDNNIVMKNKINDLNNDTTIKENVT